MPLKNFPSFFWASLVFSPGLPGFPFRVDCEDLAVVDPRVRPLRDWGSSSSSSMLDGSGRSMAVSQTDGARGA